MKEKIKIRQITQLKKIISTVDEDAFVIVMIQQKFWETVLKNGLSANGRYSYG